ncbi:MAG TPA: carboxypeptidase-like regulatory domain-containing protein, partial [Vicinamibacterales bacterium]
MRRYVMWALCLGLAVGWLLPATAFAQATGTITGVITDESGAVVPGVTVEVTNTDTNQSRSTVTGADGFYTFPLLQPGPYSIKATLQGFRTFLREGVRVTVESTSRVDVRMSVGQLEESVRVTADSPLVETASATLGTVIDEKKIVELPLNGRNFTQLGTLIPGVVAPPPALGGAA